MSKLILIPIGCRSDEGLSAPVIRRLHTNPYFEVIIIQLNAGQFYGSYGHTEQEIWDNKPDVIYITGDRIEMTAAACAAFHNNVPIIHYGAGITNVPLSTLDDVNRHCITLWADVILCENRQAYFTSWKLWDTVHKINGFEAHIVGTTHMDDLEVDESLVPDEPYDLILINPTTMFLEGVQWETIRKEISIGCNPDVGYSKDFKVDYDNLPRPQFMGLLKRCTRFITNSSSAYYEAPYFLNSSQIIIKGSRNIQRSSVYNDMEQGASDRIVSIIKKWCQKQNE